MVLNYILVGCPWFSIQFYPWQLEHFSISLEGSNYRESTVHANLFHTFFDWSRRNDQNLQYWVTNEYLLFETWTGMQILKHRCHAIAQMLLWIESFKLTSLIRRYKMKVWLSEMEKGRSRCLIRSVNENQKNKGNEASKFIGNQWRDQPVYKEQANDIRCHWHCQCAYCKHGRLDTKFDHSGN